MPTACRLHGAGHGRPSPVTGRSRTTEPGHGPVTDDQARSRAGHGRPSPVTGRSRTTKLGHGPVTDDQARSRATKPGHGLAGDQARPLVTERAVTCRRAPRHPLCHVPCATYYEPSVMSRATRIKERLRSKSGSNRRAGDSARSGATPSHPGKVRQSRLGRGTRTGGPNPPGAEARPGPGPDAQRRGRRGARRPADSETRPAPCPAASGVSVAGAFCAEPPFKFDPSCGGALSSESLLDPSRDEL